MKALIVDNEIQIICPAKPPKGEKIPEGSRIAEVVPCPMCKGARYIEKQNNTAKRVAK
jgi:hypothetical protein